MTSTAYLVFGGAPEEVRKCGLHVLGKARRKDILLRAELMPGLTHNRVDDIDSGNFVLGLAFLDKLLHALHDMLVELDGLHGCPCDGGHFRLRNGWLVLVQARELEMGTESEGCYNISTYIWGCQGCEPAVGRTLKADRGHSCEERKVFGDGKERDWHK